MIFMTAYFSVPWDRISKLLWHLWCLHLGYSAGLRGQVYETWFVSLDLSVQKWKMYFWRTLPTPIKGNTYCQTTHRLHEASPLSMQDGVTHQGNAAFAPCAQKRDLIRKLQSRQQLYWTHWCLCACLQAQHPETRHWICVRGHVWKKPSLRLPCSSASVGPGPCGSDSLLRLTEFRDVLYFLFLVYYKGYNPEQPNRGVAQWGLGQEGASP